MSSPKRNLPEYDAALDKGLNFCAGNPGPYTEYELPPSEDEAQELCLPCPMYTICNENANWVRPKHGVWGGVAWVDGRMAHLMSAEELTEALSEI